MRSLILQRFKLDSIPSRAELILGDVNNLAEIFVNGQKPPYCGHIHLNAILQNI